MPSSNCSLTLGHYSISSEGIPLLGYTFLLSTCLKHRYFSKLSPSCLQAVCAESWLPQCSHLLPSQLEICLWARLLFLFIVITSKSREVSTLSISHCSLGIFQRPFLTQNLWSFLFRKRLPKVLARSPRAQSSGLPILPPALRINQPLRSSRA